MTKHHYIANNVQHSGQRRSGVGDLLRTVVAAQAVTMTAYAQGSAASAGSGSLWIYALLAICLGLLALYFATRFSLLKRIELLEHRLAASNELAAEAEMKGNPMDEESYKDDPFSPFTDHSLALRVADEIHRMRKRLGYMEDDIKGLNALKHSLKRLEDQLNDGGYELVDLAGTKYVDGLNVEARFVPADDVTEEIITDMIRPQVNYMGVIIQQAKVEVSKSYS